MISRASEKHFNPEETDFEEIEKQAQKQLTDWGVPHDTPRNIEYHDTILRNLKGDPFQADYKPWLDKIDVALKQQYGEEDLRLSLIEEHLHKAQMDYFLGDTTTKFDNTAEQLEQNFQEYWENLETEIKNGIASGPRERSIETTLDMKIAALPEIGIEYSDIEEEAQQKITYNFARKRALTSTLKEKIEENEEELEQVAQPLIQRQNNFHEIMPLEPVFEAFADIGESYRLGNVGNTMENFRQKHRAKHYRSGSKITELYQELAGEYNSHEGTPEEKINHVFSLMPEYLELARQDERLQLDYDCIVEKTEI